jgi:hypothetical protein
VATVSDSCWLSKAYDTHLERAEFGRMQDRDVALAGEVKEPLHVMLALAAPGLKRPSHLKASFIVSCTRVFGRCSMRVTFATDLVS